MDDIALLGGLAGGVGLFLLGMGLMTDGLKLAAGSALERILARSTQTRWRGLMSGVLITSLVQSSSAVTVATIGFVNAGLLTLSQALWVLFGANVGTTTTGWLVALVGLQFKIEVLVLPMIGLGAVLSLIGPDKRIGAIGKALTGFCVLFLGIDMLKETFSGLSSGVSLPSGDGPIALLLQVGSGIALTVLMQSSSASLAIVLTAAQGGMLSAHGAAAVVIGANIGTTVTALIAALGATPNAKRAAVAHVVFNLLTGVVALLILPWLLDILHWLQIWLESGHAPATQLALFHTLFNVLGVALIWPLANRLTLWLETRFQVEATGEGRPLFLDKNILAVPALALDALGREVQHMGKMAIDALRLSLGGGNLAALVHHKTEIDRLNQTIADFVITLSRSALSSDSAERLPRILRIARYFESVAALALESGRALEEQADPSIPDPTGKQFHALALRLLQICESEATEQSQLLGIAQEDMESAYQAYKAHLLRAGSQGQLPVTQMDALLRSASSLRRALQQMTKAVNLLPPLLGSSP